MRIAADGYLDISDGRRVRTPGYYDHGVEAVPEAEALSFLLSHSFPGHRRIVRALSDQERKRIRLALWADSVSERMALVDRVWRSITEQVPAPVNAAEPQLVQVIRFEGWAYPLYLEDGYTRVTPLGGLPSKDIPKDPKEVVFEFDRKTA